MAENKYIAEQITKLNQVAQAGAPVEELYPILENIGELMRQNMKMKAQENDPDRLQPFGTPDEPNNKGFGGM